VTAHNCTISITKTPSVADVCIGSDTEVEYTITVTNNSDLFDWSGDVEDDVLGVLATGVTIPAGDSVTYTPTHTVNATTTNTVTADGTFNDSISTSDSDTASATVTAFNCTISITKTPSVANVCIGSDTEVEYTITVTNNSTFFAWTGGVEDDVLGTLATGVTIAAGDSVTYTPTHTVNATTTNTVTAAGAFSDTDASAATDSDSATVTAHDCTISITKSPPVDNVCIGSNTEVEYTITITNNSDRFDWTGDVVDDVLGILATGVTIAAGDSVTYTPTHTVNATTTNTVTATGAFNDADASAATDSTSATVTAHNCTISITKSPSVSDVCIGSDTEVTYTITVTNNSDLFDWTGDVVDDVLGTLATDVTIPAGEFVTYTPTHTVNVTTTNMVTPTGAFNDTDASAATDSASATVTGHDCTISITKAPSMIDVCTESDTEVTYTITVTNNSDEFEWTGDVVDDVLGTLATGVTIPAGEFVTYTPTHTVNATTTNTVTATGAFNDTDASAATDSASATVTAHNCTISITKIPSATDVCNGSEVTYTYTVTNNSFFTWSGSLTDDVNGTIDATITLASGETQNFSATGTVTGTVINIATADGSFDDPDATTASDTATATVTGHDCTITVTKTPSATDVCNGSEVTYTYTVTNNSFFTWSGSLVDDVNGTIDATITLAPGETQNFSAAGTVTGEVTNIATADGSFDDPDATAASDSATATVTGHDCTITVTKTPSATDVCNGSTVTYDYTVTNNSFFSWTGSLTDDVNGTIDAAIALAPGETQNFSASGVIDGVVTNIATADGSFDDPDATAASDTATAMVTGHNCTITVTKTPSATYVSHGSTVTYDYTVTNNSFFTWTGSLTDDVNGTIDDTITLAPGETQNFSATGTVTGTVTNIAIADGAFDDPDATAASDTATATVTGHNCTITVTKTPSTANVCNGSNTQVTYTYVVTNHSDFFNISGSVVDDKGTPGNPGDDVIVGTFTDLAPNDTATFTQVFTVNGTTTNTATASGTFDDPDSTIDSATASVTVTGRTCTISITKTPSTANVCNGSNTQVTYTYLVTNNSNFFSVSGSVSDNQLGSIGTFTNLAPGASTTLTKVATVNGTVTNTATATGTFNDTNSTSATATASATVTGRTCRISITKTASPSTICTSGNIQVTYTYVVKNEGTATVTNVSIVDNLLGTIASSLTLTPGQSQTFTRVATLSATTTNTATATGTVLGIIVTATASATVTANSGNCPFTPGYWKNHLSEASRFLPIRLGNFSVSTTTLVTRVFNAMNCSSNKPADAIGCLAGHLLAAKLNVANGGGNACINTVISKADTFLTKPPTTTVTFGSNSAPSINYTGPTGTYNLTTAQRNLAVSLKDALDKYNNNLGCP